MKACIIFLFLWGILQGQLEKESHQRTYSLFPILMYDSDIGLGYGGKGVVRNLFHALESFDLTLFRSSKGEQWYALAFSIPDYEIRQGKQYDFALDLKVEFDKMINSNFFGIGNRSSDNDEHFSRELSQFQVLFSHAFNKCLILEAGGRYSFYSIYDFEKLRALLHHVPPGIGESQLALLMVQLRFDSRNSRINPTRGWHVLYGLEKVGWPLPTDWDYLKQRVRISHYVTLWPEHVLAFRIWLASAQGQAPFMELPKIGDSWTARGYKADRFLDKNRILSSLEYRFPIYRRLGGVLLTDAGRVAGRFRQFSFRDWHANWGLGLRYYLKNFVVRLDVGLSHEGQRLFLNFGQVF